MADYCIVVANRARARFYNLEHPAQPEFESGPDLVEVTTLAAPELAARHQDLYTDQITGRDRRPGIGGHDYDEHREASDDEATKRFAGDIADLIRQQGAVHTIVCAEKRMLGFLRSALSTAGIAEVKEVPRDYTLFEPRELHARLAEEGLIPGRRPPGG
ncbi:host attachment protein [Spiribacter sp. 2438]|uniref:host attachment protein n=1 Tax=Spiribacter sp. 2438 TaxID=2666185 RepID=UPI0012AFDDA6|nr:host attachment protein [Spiribacter sp. 2438]QGM20984.1 host attachment protein [Spiribacter sp. 2438]